MKTQLPPSLLATSAGREADSILRACVHCGFCTATCPSYQVLGNELDSPRGRIYLIKSMLEGEAVSEVTRTHLDRCLSCRSCETTCPSGVNYHRLLDMGRAEIEKRVPRTPGARLFRRALVALMSRRQLFTPLVTLGRWFRVILPGGMRHYLGRGDPAPARPSAGHARRVILVQGCVQPGLSPATNRATRDVLDRLGIEALELAGETCCGALAYHLNEQERGLEQARRNIDTWWPLVEEGVEAIVMTASGCSSFVQDYALLLEDPDYRERAQEVVALMKDISQLLAAEDLGKLGSPQPLKIAYHCPCTAQHGQALDGPTRSVLERLGFELPAVSDAHLCCGSAGTYSLFQPQTAGELRRRKLQALERGSPERIVTANIGCQTHLQGGTDTPVLHWIEMVAAQLPEQPRGQL